MTRRPTGTITARQLNRTTLLRQSLLDRSNDDAVTAVGRLAGLQAQYANSPYIALWSRLAGFAIADLERALDERTVIKASVMRGTLHLVAARDYAALSVASSAARIASWRPSASRLGVETVELHRRLLEFAHDPRSIAEMETELEKILPLDALSGKVPAGARHVAFRMAEAHGWLVHVPPSGYWDRFAKSRYVDAGVWIPGATAPDADEAMRVAVERYLGTYGPASVADIGRWVGQPRLPRVRDALTSLGDRVRTFRGHDGRDLYDLADGPIADGEEAAPPRFLARWDSAIIGYERRDRILPDSVAGDVIRSKNGDFLPSFTVDGYVAGTWSVTRKAKETALEITPSVDVPAATRTELTDEAERLARFITRDAGNHIVRWRRSLDSH